jgi:hypothetical protein
MAMNPATAATAANLKTICLPFNMRFRGRKSPHLGAAWPSGVTARRQSHATVSAVTEKQRITKPQKTTANNTLDNIIHPSQYEYSSFSLSNATHIPYINIVNIFIGGVYTQTDAFTRHSRLKTP